MKFSIHVLLIVVTCLTCAWAAPSELILHDNAPAPQWDQGYGIGNGRVAALVYEGFPNAIILLNESSIFSKKVFSIPPDSDKAIREARELCNKGEYQQADKIFNERILEPASESGSYLPAGFLHVGFPSGDAAFEINRSLDMRKGIAESSFTLPDGTQNMQVLAAPKTDCIAARIKTDSGKCLRVTFSLEHPKIKAELDAGKGELILTGQAANGGTRYETRVRIVPDTGVIQKEGNKLIVTGGKNLLILSSTTTDYNIDTPSRPLDTDLSKANKAILDQAQKLGWPQLAREAESYYAPLMDRCQIDIGDSPADIRSMTTPKRIERIKKGGQDPDLVEQLFQFGRYCAISSSRPGRLPSTLQGLWNPSMNPPWQSCYFLNINCQMNYWPVEATNLGEFHQPFTDFVNGLLPGGQKLAQTLGYPGFCFAHNTDCWRESYFRRKYITSAPTLLNGAWASNHIIEHYRFGGDKKYLEKSLPLFRESARFLLSWLQPEPETEKLITGPSNSPECGFIYKNKENKDAKAVISNGTTHDLLLAREALRNYLETCEALGKPNDELYTKVKTILSQVAVPAIAPDGRLEEWRRGQTIQDPGHRHINHCYGIFPGSEFDVFNTPDYARAVRKSIDYRSSHGGGQTGWSASWLINLYASLRDGEKAAEYINKLLRTRISPNLFDMHPPFQIDGNFGMTAGLSQCILQSQIVKDGKRVISIAPALPKEWKEGSATGLRARGGMEVDIRWTEKEITADLRAMRPGIFLLEYGGQFQNADMQQGETQQVRFNRITGQPANNNAGN